MFKKKTDSYKTTRMGFFTGAVCGLGVQLYSNTVRRLPLMRHPWEHVLGMGIGGFIATRIVAVEEDTRADLNTMLLDYKKFGLPKFAKAKESEE